MYILLLVTCLKAISMDEDTKPSEAFSNLVTYTRSLYEFCEMNLSDVKLGFIDLFNNTNNNKLLNKIKSLMQNHERVLSLQPIKTKSYVSNDNATIIYVAHLRLWTDEVNLILRNKCIAAQFNFVSKTIRETCDYFKQQYLCGISDDNERLIFYTYLAATTDDIEKQILYLFNLIVNSGRCSSNYNLSQALVSNPNKNEFDNMNGAVNNKVRMYYANNDDQKLIRDDENGKLSRSDCIEQSKNDTLADINHLKKEDGQNVNNNRVRFNISGPVKENRSCNTVGVQSSNNGDMHIKKRDVCVNTQPESSHHNEPNKSAIDNAKYINDDEAVSSKSKDNNIKNDINIKRKTSTTKNLDHKEKDKSSIKFWEKMAIYLLVVLVIVIIIEMCWADDKNC